MTMPEGRITCPDCKGEGVIPLGGDWGDNEDEDNCPTCGGIGTVPLGFDGSSDG